MARYIDELLNRFFPKTRKKKPEPFFSPLFIDGEMLRHQYRLWLADCQARARTALETGKQPPREKTWSDYFALALSE